MNQDQAEPYLSKIRTLEFVKDARFASTSKHSGADGILKIRTPKGIHVFTIEKRSSYLDRSILNAMISRAAVTSMAGHQPLLLMARYIPTPSAEKLIQVGINFVDLAGNMHLAIGSDYVRTVLGNRESRGPADRILTPARIQLLFALTAQPESANGTVRQLSSLSGVSKSTVANLRQQFLAEGLLELRKGALAIRDSKEVEQELLRGYEQVLRPKIVIGRFRAHEPMQKLLLEKFKHVFKSSSVIWSLTGGPAASLLQSFYKGTEVPVFVSMLPDEAQRELRVLPDKAGPIIFMRSIGPLTHWKTIQGTEIAHPWLIFAELMRSEDPRAHEAADQLKSEFLSAA